MRQVRYHTWELCAGEGRRGGPKFRLMKFISDFKLDVTTVIIKVASEVVFKAVTDDIVSTTVF